MTTYISNHWRGNLPVFQAFCINMLLVGAVITPAQDRLTHYVMGQIPPQLTHLVLLLCATLLFLSIHIWQYVGCWRTAKHIETPLHRKTTKAFLIIYIVMVNLVALNVYKITHSAMIP